MYSCWTELSGIELTICIKMDLMLSSLQRLICHKTQTTNQLNWISWIRTVWINWMAWNRDVLTNFVLILNWVVWNRIICIKMDLALNNLQKLICHKKQPSLYIYVHRGFFHTVVWFQVFLSNTYNQMISTNYFYLMIIIFLHTVIWRGAPMV